MCDRDAPTGRKMRALIPRTIHLWFADDSASSGAADKNAACLKYLCVHGPRYGYFPILEKSWHICKDVDESRVQEAFDNHNLPIQMIRGHKTSGPLLEARLQKKHGLTTKLSFGRLQLKPSPELQISGPKPAMLVLLFAYKTTGSLCNASWRVLEHILN